MSNMDHSEIGRRAFLRRGLGTAGVAGVSQAVNAVSQAQPLKNVRIGMVGLGPRGQWHLKNLLANHPAVTITALCDTDTGRLNSAVDMVKQSRGTAPATYSRDALDYRHLCQRSDVDGVLIATPPLTLTAIAIDSLRAGKHTAIEVSGPQTEEECWNLIAEKRKSGKRFMFLENCSYGQDNMMVFNMIRLGVFGEPYYAEGSYVHDTRPLYFDSAGQITWRGIAQRDRYGSYYPQHGLGSNCKWLGINDGDRLESCQTMMAATREKHLRTIAQFGADSAQAKIQFREGDFISTFFQTAKGRMIRLDYSACCTRPYSRYYLFQGTRGCWDSRSGIYLSSDLKGGTPGQEHWESPRNFAAKYEHPYWRESGGSAEKTGGHGGIDYFVIADFVKMVREDREPWIDVYDAATWSAVIFCSKRSLDQNGARVAIPDFTEGKWKDPNWRKDQLPV